MSDRFANHRLPESREYIDSDYPEDYRVVTQYFATGEAEDQAAPALDRIILGLSGVSFHQAQRLQNTPRLSSLDFTQAGVEGAYDALARADPDKPPGRFLAYVGYRLFDFMYRQHAAMSETVTLNEGVHKILVRVRHIQQDVDLGLTSLEEALEAENITYRRFVRYRFIDELAHAMTLDHAENHFSDIFFVGEEADALDVYATDPGELLETAEITRIIRRMVDSLPEREQLVIKAYFGFDGQPERNLREIGEDLGVTESRVCQIMKSAKGRLGNELYEALQDD